MLTDTTLIVTPGAGSVSLVVPEERASLNNPSVSLQDPDAWDEMFNGGRVSMSGVKVSADKALSIAAVWQVVSMLSGDIAKLPLNCYERQDDDSRKVAIGSPAQVLVNRAANPEKTAFDFWRDLAVHALLWNNGYAFIDRNGRGEPMGLYNLLPDRTAPERKGGVLYFVTEVTRPDGGTYLKAIPSSDVLHIRGPSIDAMKGRELIDAAKDSWGLTLSAQGFASRFFKHGVRAGGILEIPLGVQKPASDKIVEGFTKYHEGEENWFKTVILRDGAKFHQTSIPPNEGQMNETREQQVREVCRWFNVPPSRLGLADSVSYNSKSEDNQNYLDNALSTWLRAITSQCDAKLLSATQIAASSHFFEHNTKALLRMNMKERFFVYSIAIQRGIMSPNEVRKAENMPPRDDGKGNEYADIVAASGGGKGLDGGNQNTGETIATNGDGNRGPQDAAGQSRHALHRVVYNISARARKKAENPRAFLEWLDGNLVAFRAEALNDVGSDEVVDKLVAVLKGIAETTGEKELRATVDAAMTQFEEESCHQ